MLTLSPIKIILYCLFAFEAILATLLIVLYLKSEKSVRGMKKCIGKISAFQMSKHSNCSKVHKSIIVEYYIDGVKHSSGLNCYSSKMKCGNAIDLYYDTTNPSIIQTKYRYNLIIAILLVLFSAIIAMIYTICAIIVMAGAA